jgi:ionotropic glutamate receptor NMDA 1
MFRKMQKHNVRTSDEAIQALLNDSLNAFIFDSARLEFEASRNCELRVHGPLIGRTSYSIALQKDSPWTAHITQFILQLTESGYL